MASSINASTSGAGGVITTADNTGILNIQTAGTTAVTVDASQNVGIGTTSPASKLEISDGFSTATSTGLSLTSTNGNGYGGGIRFYVSPSTAGKYTAAFLNTENSTGTANDGGRLKFYTAADDASHTLTERMRITSAGEVLIGKTTGALTSNGWALYPDEGSNYCFDMGGATNECFNYNNTGTGTYDVAFRYQATVKGYIRVNSTNTTYSTTSDYRLKENIAPMVGALEKVVQLKPVTYTWKADGSDGQGFIAHELQAVIPDAVVGEKDAVETYTDEEGNEQTRIKAQGIDTSFLVATLTAAIQEQQTIINDLKARIETLENA